MNRSSIASSSRDAFTLLEILISAALTSAIFAALLTASVTLQRSYQASSYYSAALTDQVRALDYIVRDARGALTVAVTSGSNILTMTLPDFYTAYDAQGNPAGAPYPPTISNNAVTYANAARPRTIRYFVSGGSLIREITITKTNTTSQAIIATGVDNFDFDFGILDSTVTASLTFSPRFRGISNSTDQSTTRSATIYMRNH